MLKHELAQALTCEQYGAALRTLFPKPHALPDGRFVEWYPDYEVHEFVKAWEQAHPTPRPPMCGQEEQLELPLENIGGEAVRVYPCVSPTDTQDSDGRTGS